MSSSPSKTPYKSKLLNFLNRQYININDKVSKSFRHLTSAVKFGLQTTLYPIYLLIQSSRFLTKQIKSVFTGEKVSLNQSENIENYPLPSADKSIKEVFKAISSDKIFKSLPSINIQGLAINLANNHLVLVDSHNNIKDIFSEEQTKYLTRLIREVRGDYWEEKRLFAKRKKQENTNIFPLIKPNPSQQMGMLYLLWKLMEWVQKSKVAIALNVFKESTFISDDQFNDNISFEKSKNISSPPQILINLDQSLTIIENKYFLNKDESILTHENQTQELNFDKDNNNVTNNHQSNNVSLLMLIKLAIDYYFGEKQNQVKFNKQNLHKSPALTSNNDLDEKLLNNKELKLPSEKSSSPAEKVNLINKLQNKIITALDSIWGINKATSIVKKNSDISTSKPLNKITENKVNLSANVLEKIDSIKGKIANKFPQILPKSKENSDDLILESKIEFEKKEVAINKEKYVNRLPHNPNLPHNPFQIKYIIGAGIEYFLNEKKMSSSNSLNTIDSDDQLIIEEKWLDWDDLYINDEDSEILNNPKLEKKSAEIDDLLTKKEEIQAELVDEYEEFKNKDNYEIPREFYRNVSKQESQLSVINNDLNSVDDEKDDDKDNKVLEFQPEWLNMEEPQKEFQPEWLDIKATKVGYEKHFLQTILEWLDKIILWLEQLLIKIWHRLK